MDRIRLSHKEKAVLRNVALGCSYKPEEVSEAVFSACVAALENKGFVRAPWTNGHEACAVEITDFGRAYLQENPHLCNPIDWSKITAIATAISATIAIIAFFVACKVLMNR